MDDVYEADGRGVDKKHRKCMFCGNYFLSWGPGNRTCEECRHSNRHLKHAGDFHGVRSKRGVKPGVRHEGSKDE